MPNKIKRDLSKPTPGEWVWLNRIFGQNISQDVAALKLGISHRRYVDIELDRYHPTPLLKGPKKPVNLALGYLLRLARRRSGRQLRPLAKALGVSHVTLIKMERQGDQRLVGFWKSQGFRF